MRLVATATILLAAVAARPPLAASPSAGAGPRILVFTKTAGFRHTSIPAALRTVRALSARQGLAMDATEDAAAFSSRNLARYDADVYLLTTGDVLNAAQQAAFKRFIRAGGGFAGVHSAADTEYEWPWYGELVGAYFRSHPHVQRARIRVERRNDPSTAGLPVSWTRTDEWYNFARNPRRSVRVLAALDESSYEAGPGAMGRDHPIAWAQEFEGGRAWFTGGGHSDEAYAEPLFRRHLIGGIRYAAGVSPPRIVSAAPRVRHRRLHLTIRYVGCRPCRGIVRVGRSSAAMRLAGDHGLAVSGVLSRGRHPFTVTLEDRPTGLIDSARGSVRVR